MQYIGPVLLSIFILGYFFVVGSHARFRTNITNLPSVLLGFVIYTSAFQLLGLPFLLTHANPRLFLLTAGLLTAGWFLWAVYDLRNRLGSLFFKPNRYQILFIGSVVVALALGLATQRYDIDDSFYLGMAADNLTTSSTYSHDPSTGISTYPMSEVYSLGTYELSLSLLSLATGLDVATTAHISVALAVTSLSFLAYLVLARTLLRKEHSAYIVSSIFAVVLLFSSFSPYLSSNFILARSWQGKSILIGVFIPLVLTLSIQLFSYLKLQQKHLAHRTLWLLLAAEIGAFAVSPVSIYMLPPVLLVGFIATADISSLSVIKRQLLLGVVAMSPLVLFAIVLALWTRNSVALDEIKGIALNIDQWLQIIHSFYGRLSIILLVSATVVFLLIQKESIAVRRLTLGIVTSVFMLANPILAPFIADHFTSAVTYWRLFWLTFPELLFALAIYLGYSTAKRLKLLRPLTVTVVVLTLLLSNPIAAGFMFRVENGFMMVKNPQKVPQSAVGAAALPDGSLIFADQLTAAYIRAVNPHLQVAYSRENYMSNVLYNDSERYLATTDVFRALNGSMDRPLGSWITGTLQNEGVDYIIYQSGNTGLRDFTKNSSAYRTLKTPNDYTVQSVVY